MSVVFRREGKRGRIEVRRAGGTLRLYLGGVLSSHGNPRHALTGGYWDGLGTAPLLSPAPCGSALVLGVGGGGVLHVLRRIASLRSIVGVEIDREVLAIARKHFPLDGKDAAFVIADAFGFVRRCRRKFDLVADDVYGVVAGEATRPKNAGRAWFESLARRLTPTGVLAVNFVDGAAREAADPDLLPVLECRFASSFVFRFDAYYNEVVAACRAKSSVHRFERALSDVLSKSAFAGRRFTVSPYP